MSCSLSAGGCSRALWSLAVCVPCAGMRDRVSPPSPWPHPSPSGLQPPVETEAYSIIRNAVSPPSLSAGASLGPPAAVLFRRERASGVPSRSNASGNHPLPKWKPSRRALIAFMTRRPRGFIYRMPSRHVGTALLRACLHCIRPNAAPVGFFRVETAFVAPRLQ